MVFGLWNMFSSLWIMVFGFISLLNKTKTWLEFVVLKFSENIDKKNFTGVVPRHNSCVRLLSTLKH